MRNTFQVERFYFGSGPKTACGVFGSSATFLASLRNTARRGYDLSSIALVSLALIFHGTVAVDAADDNVVLQDLPPILTDENSDNLVEVTARDTAATAAELYSDGRNAFEDGRMKEAKFAFERLVGRFPDAEQVTKARRYLAAIYNAKRPGQGKAGPLHAAVGASRLGGSSEHAAGGSGTPVENDRLPKDQYVGLISETMSDRLGLDVGDRVFFAPGSAELGTRASVVLSGQANWLKQRPSLNAVIAGHADEQGDVAYNEALSIERARAVRERLIEEGIDAERLAVDGLGRRERLAPCQSALCGAQNRRAVMLVLTRHWKTGMQSQRSYRERKAEGNTIRAW